MTDKQNSHLATYYSKLVKVLIPILTLHFSSYYIASYVHKCYASQNTLLSASKYQCTYSYD